jgi:hypothetical protein
VTPPQLSIDEAELRPCSWEEELVPDLSTVAELGLPYCFLAEDSPTAVHFEEEISKVDSEYVGNDAASFATDRSLEGDGGMFDGIFPIDAKFETALFGDLEMGDSGEDREANRKEKTPTQRTADPAIKKEPRSPRVAATQGGREFLPSTDIAIEFDLRTQMWKVSDPPRAVLHTAWAVRMICRSCMGHARWVHHSRTCSASRTDRSWI